MTLEERIRYKLGYMILDYQQKRIDKNSFGGLENLTKEEANSRITEAILSGKPFAVMRVGISELQFLSVHTGMTRIPADWFYGMWVRDLFPDKEDADHFIRLYTEAYSQADFFANWYYFDAEGRLLERYAPQAVGCPSRVVEPYFLQNPWTNALQGKKVLVVNPFTDTIRYQYARKEAVWPDGLLPEFELHTIQSVWYNTAEGNGQFSSWFDALEYLQEEVLKADFDIALLGCGPFGTPLTSFIKKMGKQAIYIGGALQILFGIKGNRWDAMPEIRAFYNDAWVRAGEDNKPVTTANLDNDCFW